LVARCGRRIAGFVRPLIRQPDAVEDVTQTVFIKMFRRLGGLRDLALFEAWLFTLARNTALDFIRRRNRPADHRWVSTRLSTMCRTSATTRPRWKFSRRSTVRSRRLSPLDQSLIRQFIAGESYDRIAAEAGLSLGAVKVRLHRVRPFLRNWVGAMTETRLPGERRRRAA
jgi:RNA polymerase sigma-70 factor (ECF subfamily)